MALLLILSALSQPTVPDEAAIRGLVDQLGSDYIEKREAAMQDLADIGLAVEPVLKKAIRTSDTEIAWRARKILQELTGHRKAVKARVSCLLYSVKREARGGKINACIASCNRILEIAPRYPVVLELRRAAVLARDDELAHLDLMRRVAALARISCGDLPLPRPDSFHFPTRKEWLEIQSKMSSRHIEELDEDVHPAIRRKLQTLRIDMAFEKTKLEDILAFVRDFTGLNILIDASLRGDEIDLDKLLAFKVKDIKLEGALKLLLYPLGLQYRVTREHVVLITARCCTR